MLFLLLTVPSWAAPISVDVDRNVNLALGTKSFGPLQIPDELTFCKIEIDRTNWTNPAATLTATLNISVNGGQARLWRSITAVGSGALTDRSGNPVTVTMIQGVLPSGINREVSGSYVVSGARFISTVSVTCT